MKLLFWSIFPFIVISNMPAMEIDHPKQIAKVVPVLPVDVLLYLSKFLPPKPRGRFAITLKSCHFCSKYKEQCKKVLLDAYLEQLNLDALFDALEFVDLDIIKIMVMTEKVNLSYRDNKGYTPLEVVSQTGRMRCSTQKFVTQLLLDYGANPNSSESIDTPLHLACDHHYIQTGAILIHYGTDVNHQTHDGSTPLHRLVNSTPYSRSTLSFARLLLNYHANPNLTDHSGNTVLDCAFKGRNRKLIALLRKYDGYSSRDKKGIVSEPIAHKRKPSDHDDSEHKKPRV